MNESSIEAVFLDRDGVINEEVNLLHKTNQLKLIPGSAKAIRMLNNGNVKVIIITNQPVVARNMCTEEQLKDIHLKLIELLRKEGAHIDDIFYCPHHPDPGYPEENSAYKINCECRKPSIGLLQTAIFKHKLNPKRVLIVGDTTTDIMTGINAGIETSLVNTGYQGSDMRFNCKPNYAFRDLLEFAEFVRKYNLISKDIQVLILAGGKGERLKEVTGLLPKPMISIIGKPLLEHIIVLLRNQGFSNILISTGFGAKYIQDYFQTGDNFSVRINYSHEMKALGTGGAIKQALELLPEVFILIFGDLLLKMNIPKLIRYHLYKNSFMTLTIHQSDHPEDSDVIVVDEDIVTKIHHKPGNKFYGNLTNAGVYVINKSFLRSYMNNKIFAFDKDLLPMAIDSRRIFGYQTNEYIKDIGTPNRYFQAIKEWS